MAAIVGTASALLEDWARAGRFVNSEERSSLVRELLAGAHSLAEKEHRRSALQTLRGSNVWINFTPAKILAPTFVTPLATTPAGVWRAGQRRTSGPLMHPRRVGVATGVIVPSVSRPGFPYGENPAYLSRIKRADERARTADLSSLRVISQVLQGVAPPCKTRISRRLPLLWFAACCTVLLSRWCQSGVNTTLVSAQQCHPPLGLVSPNPTSLVEGVFFEVQSQDVLGSSCQSPVACRSKKFATHSGSGGSRRICAIFSASGYPEARIRLTARSKS
jgi:hypothetical protein